MHIETGRTHQIRVHLASLGHPVVGDTLYGAPHRLTRPGVSAKGQAEDPSQPALARNFLHAAELRFAHPRTGAELHLSAPLPEELEEFLKLIAASREAATHQAEKNKASCPDQ